jgi:outer membrane biosynthesis protein TonB
VTLRNNAIYVPSPPAANAKGNYMQTTQPLTRHTRLSIWLLTVIGALCLVLVCAGTAAAQVPLPDDPDKATVPDTPDTPPVPDTPDTPPPPVPDTPDTSPPPVTPPPDVPDTPPTPPESNVPEAPPPGSLEQDRGSVQAEQQSGGETGYEQTTVVAGPTGSATGTLPFTGVESLLLALIGLLALGFGAGLQRAVRPRP